MSNFLASHCTRQIASIATRLCRVRGGFSRSDCQAAAVVRGPPCRQRRAIHGSFRSRAHAQVAEVESTEAPPFPRAPDNGLPVRFNQTELPINRQGHDSRTAPDRAVSTHIDPIYLRDLCSCEICLDPSSGQKNVWTTDIPADIRVKTRTEVGAGITEFTWENDVPGMPDGHATRISHAALTRALYGNRRSGHGQTRTWDKTDLEERLLRIDHREYLSDDSVLSSALHALRETGLVLVQGIPESEEAVVQLAERIGPLKNTFYGMTWDVRSVPKALNVAYTSQHLGFHMDLLYMKSPPKLQLLHCIRSSAAGGMSLFSDTHHAIKQLHERSPEIIDELRTITTKYGYSKGGHNYERIRPFLKTTPNAGGAEPTKDIASVIENVYWSPPFQKPNTAKAAMTSDDGFHTWHRVAKTFRDEIERPENVFEHLLKPGECFIFDNLRVVHARTAFEAGDAGKERWLKGCYVDGEVFECRLRHFDLL